MNMFFFRIYEWYVNQIWFWDIYCKLFGHKWEKYHYYENGEQDSLCMRCYTTKFIERRKA